MFPNVRCRYNLLLTDDPSNWPLHAFVNLPLIPFSLVLSRTRLFDHLPIVPLFLAWTSSPPVPTTERLIAAHWNPTIRIGENYPTAPLFTWPPSPIIATLLFPLATGFYRRNFSRLRHYVMGTRPTPRPPVRGFVWALNEDGPAPLRVRIGANIEQEQGPPPAGVAQQQEQGEHQRGQDEDDHEQEDARADDPAVVAERTLRVTNASLGRFIGGALMMPAISNLMGSLLFRLSKHSQTLHRFLAIRPATKGSSLAPLSGWFENQPWNKMGYAKQFGMGIRVALNLVCSGTRTWAECDPVWLGLPLAERRHANIHLLLQVEEFDWSGHFRFGECIVTRSRADVEYNQYAGQRLS